MQGRFFKKTCELIKLIALKFLLVNEIHIFQCMGKIYIEWNFKSTIWNYTQNILPVQWKIWFLYNIWIWRALRFMGAYTFLKRKFKKIHLKKMLQSVNQFVHQTCADSYRLFLQPIRLDVDNCIVKYLIICHSLYIQFGCHSIYLHTSIYQPKRYAKKSGI